MRSKSRIVAAVMMLAASGVFAQRHVPTVAAMSDVADWRVAAVGRDKLPPAAGKDAVLVITGGAFVSAMNDPSAAAARSVAMIDAAGFDAVNLAHRDLETDLASLAKAKTPLISASFTAPEQPWKSHAIVERGGRKYALIGVAARSPMTPMGKLTYVEPDEAIRRALADAGAVDGVILLADAPVADVAGWMSAHPQIDAAVVSARGGGSPAVAGNPRIARAVTGGAAISVLPNGAEAHGLSINQPDNPAEPYRQIASSFGMDARTPSVTKAPPTAPRQAPTAFELNRLVPVGLTVSNRAVEVTVQSGGVFDVLGAHAADGKRYLVLDLQFKNILTPQVVRDQLVPVAYQIPKLSDHLYLVADEQRVLRPAKLDDVAGMLQMEGQLMLDRAGYTHTGRLVYEIDLATPPRELSLRLYDFAHGSINLPVLARSADDPRVETKAIATARNEVLEVAAYNLSRTDELNGEKAPPGMTFVSVDLRARSLVATQAAASGPNARAGQKIKVGTVADWTESRKYLQLVADAEYAYVPEAATALDPAPRFLPDVMTGDRVVFLAPKEAKSLELRCDFPNARTPDGKVIRPRGFNLALDGQRPPQPNRKSLAKIEDDVYLVTIVDQTTPATFAGHKPEDGKRFVVLDINVQNRNREAGEFFQTIEQLKIAGADGNPIAIDKEVTYAGPYRPTELVWIPVNDRRSFQVVYQLPLTETRPRLLYSGVSKAETIELARLAPAAAPTEGGVTVDASPATDQPQAQPASDGKKPAKSSLLEVRGKRFPSRVPIRPNIQPKGLAGVGLKPEDVNQAIDRGMAFLWNHIKTKDLDHPNAVFGEDAEHVLAALALVHCGAHKKFADFDLHLRKMLASWDVNYHRNTYQTGLYCMLIEAYGDPTYLPQLRKATRWLVDNQGPLGSWGYGRALDAKLFAPEDESKKVLLVSGGRPLDGSDVAEPMIRITPQDNISDGDNSTSQYALLGLHAASRLRIRADARIWQAALASYRERQTPDGGWAYTTSHTGYGSMTGAGICALAIARHELGPNSADEKDYTERIERGLAWLNAHFTVHDHPGNEGKWIYYYLYALERVGRVLDTEFIGEHEWYPLGAQALVSKQEASGAWIGPGEEGDPRIATSFALLFLTRATPTLTPVEQKGPGVLRTAVKLPPGRKLYIILDASGSMLEEMDGRPKIDIARDALTALVKELPANTEVALRAYGYRKRAIEEGANEDSKLLIPMGKLDRDKLLMILNGIRARGKTPLAFSLEQAVEELDGATPEDPITVVLLTDGGEDTQPRKDPVAAAAKFAKLPNVRLRIIGFDINRADWTEQLRAMAAAAGGQYLTAAKTDSLLRELRTAVFETPENFIVFDQSGNQVAAGAFGTQVSLPAGKYSIRATYAGQTFEEQFWINAGGATAVTFNAIAVPVGGTAAAPAPATPSDQKPKSAFCTHCGQPLSATAKFCTHCGTPVKR